MSCMSLSTIRSQLKALQRKVEELGERSIKPVRFDFLYSGDPEPPEHDEPHLIISTKRPRPADNPERSFIVRPGGTPQFLDP